MPVCNESASTELDEMLKCRSLITYRNHIAVSLYAILVHWVGIFVILMLAGNNIIGVVIGATRTGSNNAFHIHTGAKIRNMVRVGTVESSI